MQTCGAGLAVESTGPSAARCGACGTVSTVKVLPLIAVSGPYGVGKSTTGFHLAQLLPECVVLDQDILWRDEYEGSQEAIAEFRRTWLRLAIHLNQSGRPLVLTGTVMPDEYESIEPERQFFTNIHYLALQLEDAELERRVLASTRHRRAAGAVRDALWFNEWLRENASNTNPPMSLVSLAASDSPIEVATLIAERVRQALLT